MKINIVEKREIPTHYLNLPYYLKKYLGALPPPPLDQATKQPIGPDALARLFPMALIRQEVSLEKEIPIPEEVRELYATEATSSTPLSRRHITTKRRVLRALRRKQVPVSGGQHSRLHANYLI